MKNTLNLQIRPASYHSDYKPIIVAPESTSEAEISEFIRYFTGAILNAVESVNLLEANQASPSPTAEERDQLRRQVSQVISHHGFSEFLAENEGRHPRRLMRDFVEKIDQLEVIKGQSSTLFFENSPIEIVFPLAKAA